MILDPAESSQVVERLRRELDPLKIFLFGSQARGDAKAEVSNVDICVVVDDDDEQTHRKTVRAYHSLADMAFPKDIIVRHSSKFEQRSKWINFLEREVSKTGLLLYSLK
jgi:predicted nucleotidyltransferase